MKKWFVFGAVLLLLIAHQDYWQWGRTDLLFGFLPYPMAYHIGISLVTALVWLIVVSFCWPRDAEDVPANSESDSAAMVDRDGATS